MPTIDTFFTGHVPSRALFEVIRQAIEDIGPAELQISKSQVAFKRRKIIVRLWIPEQYLHRQAAPLVLTFSFPERDPSSRWKEIVEPYPGRFTHHLELFSSDDIDEQVRAWLQKAWEAAG